MQDTWDDFPSFLPCYSISPSLQHSQPTSTKSACPALTFLYLLSYSYLTLVFFFRIHKGLVSICCKFSGAGA